LSLSDATAARVDVGAARELLRGNKRELIMDVKLEVNTVATK
jgi:hypothetical protein